MKIRAPFVVTAIRNCPAGSSDFGLDAWKLVETSKGLRWGYGCVGIVLRLFETARDVCWHGGCDYPDHTEYTQTTVTPDGKLYSQRTLQ